MIKFYKPTNGGSILQRKSLEITLHSVLFDLAPLLIIVVLYVFILLINFSGTNTLFLTKKRARKTRNFYQTVA